MWGGMLCNLLQGSRCDRYRARLPHRIIRRAPLWLDAGKGTWRVLFKNPTTVRFSSTTACSRRRRISRAALRIYLARSCARGSCHRGRVCEGERAGGAWYLSAALPRTGTAGGNSPSRQCGAALGGDAVTRDVGQATESGARGGGKAKMSCSLPSLTCVPLPIKHL